MKKGLGLKNPFIKITMKKQKMKNKENMQYEKVVEVKQNHLIMAFMNIILSILFIIFTDHFWSGFMAGLNLITGINHTILHYAKDNRRVYYKKITGESK